MKVISDNQYQEMMSEARQLLKGTWEEAAIGRGMLRVLISVLKAELNERSS